MKMMTMVKRRFYPEWCIYYGIDSVKHLIFFYFILIATLGGNEGTQKSDYLPHGLRAGGGRAQHSTTKSRALNHGVISTELVQELTSGDSFLFIFITSEKCLFNLSPVFFFKKPPQTPDNSIFFTSHEPLKLIMCFEQINKLCVCGLI